MIFVDDNESISNYKIVPTLSADVEEISKIALKDFNDRQEAINHNRVLRDLAGPKITNNPDTTGYKLDTGKPALDIVLGDFAKALVMVGRVGTKGLEKYPPSNWLGVEGAQTRYQSALLRHYFSYKEGVEIDDESGLPHLAHAAWNALAALELYLRSIK